VKQLVYGFMMAVSGLLLSLTGTTVAGAVVVPGDDIAKAVVAYLDSAYADSGYDMVFDVKGERDLDLQIDATPGISVSHQPVALPARIIPVTVELIDRQGAIVRKLRQTVHPRYFAVAVVAVVDIGRGEAVGDSQLELRRAEVTGLEHYYVSLDGLDGIQTKRYLNTGQVITPENVRVSYIVSRGDRVMVEVRDASFVIRTEGTARQGGSLGERISVYIDMTKRTISGIVIDKNTVLTDIMGG
jgi:flagella basal body P-ring formation protein FlgA